MSETDPTAPRRERLELRAGTFAEFVEAYSPWISPEGVFLATGEPYPVGTRLELEISLSDDFRLIRGVGTVVWAVTVESGETPGMAVRFFQLDDPSRRLIGRLVEQHEERGGTVFSLSRLPGSGTPASSPPQPAAATPEPERPSSEAESPTLRKPAGRPSRTPIGEDAVLIPAPTAAGEPSPHDEEPAGEEIVMPEVPLADRPGGGAETVRVDDFRPLRDPGFDASNASESADEPTPEPATVSEPPARPMRVAGVGRVRTRPRVPRLALLVGLLLATAAAALYVSWERVWPILGGLAGGGSEEEPVAAAERPAADRGIVSRPATPLPEGIAEEAAPAGEGDAGEAETGSPEVVEAPSAVAAAPSGVAAAVEAPPAADLPRLTRVLAVRAEAGTGETLLVLTADGRFTEDAYQVLPVQGGAPRVVIRVLGVDEPFDADRVTVGTSEVAAVRVGLHLVSGRRDVHFVADLTARDVRLAGVEAAGDTLRVRFVR